MAESIIIYRKNGTPVNVSAYVSKMQINRGDVTGFGELGFEGVAHTLSLTLNNSKEINFSPFSEKVKTYLNMLILQELGARCMLRAQQTYIPKLL